MSLTLPPVYHFSLLKRPCYNNTIAENVVVKFGNTLVDINKFTTIVYECIAKEPDSQSNDYCANMYIAQSDHYKPPREEIEATKQLAFSAMPMQKLNGFDKRLRWIIDGRITLQEYETETKQLTNGEIEN